MAMFRFAFVSRVQVKILARNTRDMPCKRTDLIWRLPFWRVGLAVFLVVVLEHGPPYREGLKKWLAVEIRKEGSMKLEVLFWDEF